MTAPRARAVRWLVVAPAVLLFALHAALFGAWQIDDAGISFAYARNLATGHGLVAQPGAAPVEGYSNPLWVFMLAGTMVLRLFDPLWTPKILSLALSCGTFVVLDRLHGRLGVGALPSLGALLLLASQTSFVIWSVSGLENPLYALLATALALSTVDDATDRETARSPLWAGALAAGLALTRPEGILFAALYPIALAWPDRARSLAERARRLGAYLATFAGPVALHHAVRRIWFGDWLPNTYWAKWGASAKRGWEAEPLHELATGLFGPQGAWLAAAVVAGALALAAARRLDRPRLLLLTAAAVAALPYLLLPKDWMPELRFATPLFPTAAAALAVLATSAAGSVAGSGQRANRLSTLALAGLLAWQLTGTVPRSRAFAARPTVPFATVQARYGHGYNRIADRLGVEHGSILLPDVGGTLWSSRLTVYDLAGLCDRTIARTINRRNGAFRDYVFDTLRPTFIHSHGWWTRLARLDTDPRFARDYAPLDAYPEPTDPRRRSGDFVRREIARRRPEVVAAIGRELAERRRREGRETRPAAR